MNFRFRSYGARFNWSCKICIATSVRIYWLVDVFRNALMMFPCIDESITLWVKTLSVSLLISSDRLVTNLVSCRFSFQANVFRVRSVSNVFVLSFFRLYRLDVFRRKRTNIYCSIPEQLKRDMMIRCLLHSNCKKHWTLPLNDFRGNCVQSKSCKNLQEIHPYRTKCVLLAEVFWLHNRYQISDVSLQAWC